MKNPFKRKKDSKIAKGNWSRECEKWLGKELEEEKRVLNEQHLSREDLARLYIISRKNWLLAMGEIKELEEKIRKLEVQIKIMASED